MRFLFLTCLFLISTMLLAENTLPNGCHGIKVEGESVLVKNKKGKVIFIHNLSNSDLWITHPVTNPGASAGWTSQLQADKWSALTVSKFPFILNCVESKPGHEQQIPCEGAVAVCQWNKVKMPSDAEGTFWVSENLSLAALIAAVEGRGFNLSSDSEMTKAK